MKRRELLPRLENRAFEMLHAEGLESSEFEWQITKGPWAHHEVSLLMHRRTGFRTRTVD